MWADGEEPITVQMRRKSDPALEANGIRNVSLKIDINNYVPGQKCRDLTKLSLENGNGGNGPVREGLSMNLHRLASEHGFYEWSAGYASWVRVVANGEYIGLYASPEQRNKQFLRNRGLYKPGSVLLYEVNGGTELNTTIATSHSPTYQHMCTPFRNACAQPADLEADLEQWIDMAGMLTMAAIEAFTGNSDGLFTKDGKNSFAVEFLPSGQYRRWYLPWDLDNGMTNTTFDIYSGGPGPQCNRPYQVHIISNMLEYAFGLDPTVPSIEGIPTVGMIEVDGEGFLVITYRRLLDAPDLSYTVEFGSDPALGLESTVGESFDSQPTGDGVTTLVSARDTVPISQSSRRFGRVVVRHE